MKRFYYMRHGQVDANLDGILCGGDWKDIPLNATGVAQVSAHDVTLRSLANIRTVCVSPALRATQTADIVMQNLKAECIVIDDLKEWCLGVWDRKPYNEVIPQGTTLLDHDPPGGETREEFEKRVTQAFNICSQKAGDVLMISHGAVWMMLASHFGLKETRCANGAILEVCLGKDQNVRVL